MAREIKYADLSKEQREFLSTYVPEQKGFTSEKEMDLIIEKLNLNQINDIEEFRAIRNSVVKLYSDAMKEHYDEWEKMEAMQSCTAVIDYCMYNLCSNSEF